jgi:hypothetical protein
MPSDNVLWPQAGTQRTPSEPFTSHKGVPPMKITGLIALSCFVATLGLAHAAGAAPPQQNKMKACNAAADEKGLSGEGKGEARQAFIKECLSAKSGKGGKTAQQEKMKTCNKEAGDKKLAGEERKQFMSSCLSS